VLNNSIQKIKTMTSETYPLKPIDVCFDITFTHQQLFYNSLVENNGDSSFDAKNSYLEVTITDNSIYSTTSLVNQIQKIVIGAFDPLHCKLGQPVDYS